MIRKKTNLTGSKVILSIRCQKCGNTRMRFNHHHRHECIRCGYRTLR